MQIGTMNHPARDLVSEIKWIAEMGFQFVDLTLEPPLCGVRSVNLTEVRTALEHYGLNVVGHTAYYLPLCSPFESIRRAAVEELKLCLEAFSFVGAAWMNLHPDRNAPMHDRKTIIDRNLLSLRDLLPAANETGVGLMIENLPGGFNTVQQIGELLLAMPELGLHLDIGHANLLVEQNTTESLLNAFGSRLKHVHMHDNKGGSADLHLPLGAGNMDTALYVKLLQRCGYDGTITLEVFTPDRHYLDYSQRLLRKLWDAPLPSRTSTATAEPAARCC